MSDLQKASRRKRMKFLRHWFNEFDKHFFLSFFEDKYIKIVVKRFMGGLCVNEWIAYACLEDKEIGIDERNFDSLTQREIRECLLHEMIHLFIAFTYKDGVKKGYWDDDSKVFKAFQRDFMKIENENFEGGSRVRRILA